MVSSFHKHGAWRGGFSKKTPKNWVFVIVILKIIDEKIIIKIGVLEFISKAFVAVVVCNP